MAIQTLTTSVAPTSTDVSTDTNANSNLFGNNGAAPIIPAFIVAGLLLIALVIMMAWRRMTHNRLLALVGAGAGEMVPPGAGLAREREGTMPFGPEPRLWDVCVANGRGADDLRETTWKGMKPLCAAFPSQTPPSVVKTFHLPASRASHRPPPFLMRRILRVNRHLNFEGAHDPGEPQKAKTPDVLRVGVIIALPSPTRRRQSEKEKEIGERVSHVDPGDDSFNYMLGLTEVPWGGD